MYVYVVSSTVKFLYCKNLYLNLSYENETTMNNKKHKTNSSLMIHIFVFDVFGEALQLEHQKTKLVIYLCVREKLLTFNKKAQFI